MPFVKKNKHWLVILIGSITWLVTMVKNGLTYSYGLGFWGPNGHDGIWHISLIQSLSRGSLDMPIFAGEAIKNYHLGFDLLVTFIHLITKLPVTILYFQIFPVLISALIGLLAYFFILSWQKSKLAALWTLFFVYFGGSLGWVMGAGESVFWAQQSISTLINPPYAFSLALLLLGLILLHKNRFLSAILVFSILPEIKIYIGLLSFAGLALGSLKNKKWLKVLLPSVIISLGLFMPLNSSSVKLLHFQPLWFLETMMGPDRLNSPKFFSALNTYRISTNLLKGIPAFSLALLIFTLGNFGTRLIGLVKAPKKLDALQIFLITVVVVGLFIPMLFTQSGTAWNTIQFFYYSQFALGLLAGISFASLRPNKLLCLMIVLLTIPTTLGTLRHYLPKRPPAKISSQELSALTFLGRLPQGVVLTPVFDKSLSSKFEHSPPRPLYLYESTGYISAYSGQQTYLADEVNLNITGYDWKSRHLQIVDFFSGTYPNQVNNFLTTNHISYVYIPKLMPVAINLAQFNLSKVYSDSETEIWKVPQKE